MATTPSASPPEIPVAAARPSLRASLGAALRIARVQLRLSLLLSMQYRWDFIGQGAMQLLWLALSAVPLLVAYKARAAALGGDLLTTEISGWGFYPAAMVFGFFFLLKAVLDGVINPSLVSAVDQIRKGTLDFLLLKPADAQLLVSLARVEPWHALNGLAALAIIAMSRPAQADRPQLTRCDHPNRARAPSSARCAARSG
jgi:ABC-2 type transport system permease protein